MIYKLFGKHFQFILDDNQSPDEYEPTVHRPSTATLDNDDVEADHGNEATNRPSSAHVTFKMEPHQEPTKTDNNQIIAAIATSDDEQHSNDMEANASIGSNSNSNSNENSNNIDQLIRICHSIITSNSINGLSDDELSMLCEHMPSIHRHKTIEIEVFAAQKTKYAKLRAYHQRRIKQLNNEIIRSEQIMESLQRRRKC